MGIGAGVAAAAVAGTVASGVMQSNAAGKAAKAQQSADQQSIDLQKQQLQQEQANQAPWLQTGAGALGQLSKLYGISTQPIDSSNAGSAASTGYNANTGGATGGYTNAAGGSSTVDPNASFYLSPDFNFTLTQGLKGLTAQGAATNGTNNGATQKAEIQYAGNLAAGQYDSYKAGLMSLAGLGENSATATNAATAATSTNASNLTAQKGSNLASSYLGQGQLYGNMATSIAGIAGQYGPAIYNGLSQSNSGGSGF